MASRSEGSPPPCSGIYRGRCTACERRLRSAQITGRMHIGTQGGKGPWRGHSVHQNQPSTPRVSRRQVFLCDAESRCYLCPTETANATRLTCRAGRVPNATYTVRLTQPQRGFAGPAFTVDALFLINGVSPASGSTAGGALLTLTGRGFCDGVVLMAGPTREQGLDCAPQYMSDAEMQCRLQDNWRTYAGAHTLRLYADNDEAIRNGVHAACDAAVCVHEFAAAATPTITGATGLTGNAGDVLTLTGTGLAGHSANVTVGDVECAPAAGTDTELQCALAGVGVAGPGHTIAVMVNPQGLAVWTGAAAAATYHFALRVTAFAPASGSLGGGLALTIEGQGFGPSAAVTLVGAGPCPVLGRSRTYLVCRTPPAAAAGGHAVRVDVGNSSATAAGQFQFQTGLTPQAASLSPGTGTLGTVLTIGGTGLADVNVSVAGTECDVTANTATSVTCTLGPVPGTTAPVRVASAHGWAVNAFPDFVSTLSVASVAPATTSFVGGTRLTVAGVGFTGAAEDISFTVCGAPAAVLSTEYGQAVIETPPLVTLHTLAAYMPDAEPYQLAATAIGPNSAAVFDGDVSSHGTVTSYVGMDMGPLAKAWLTALWFFPRLTGQDSRVQMMEAKPSFQVSNDSVTWEDIPGLTGMWLWGRRRTVIWWGLCAMRVMWCVYEVPLDGSVWSVLCPAMWCHVCRGVGWGGVWGWRASCPVAGAQQPTQRALSHTAPPVVHCPYATHPGHCHVVPVPSAHDTAPHCTTPHHTIQPHQRF